MPCKLDPHIPAPSGRPAVSRAGSQLLLNFKMPHSHIASIGARCEIQRRERGSFSSAGLPSHSPYEHKETVPVGGLQITIGLRSSHSRNVAFRGLYRGLINPAAEHGGHSRRPRVWPEPSCLCGCGRRIQCTSASLIGCRTAEDPPDIVNKGSNTRCSTRFGELRVE